MGFRFRKSLKIAPGLRMNLSKSGTSFSIGRPGATLNVGGKTPRATIGIRGTGLSYSENLTSPPAANETDDGPPGLLTSLFGLLFSLVQLALVVGGVLILIWVTVGI